MLCCCSFKQVNFGGAKPDPIDFLSISEYSQYHWQFQEPNLEVPSIYKAYVREYPRKIWPYMVEYLHFWDPEITIPSRISLDFRMEL